MTKLVEFFESSLDKIDAPAGIVRDVRILGRVSKNGRRYSDKAIESAAKLYDGRKVNVNHIREGKGDRPFQDFFGEIRNVRMMEGEVRGDLHYLTTHDQAAKFAEAAQKFPRSFGLSHHAEGVTKRDGKETIVEDVTAVVSVDLVSDPASNSGLFESVAPQYADANPGEGGAGVDPRVQDAASQIAVYLFGSDKSDEQVMKELMLLRRIIKGGEADPEMDDEEADTEMEGEGNPKKPFPKKDTKESVMKPEEITKLVADGIEAAVKPLKESLDGQAATIAAQALQLKCHNSGVTPTAELLESFKGKDAAFIDGKLAEMAAEQLKEGKKPANAPANQGPTRFDYSQAKGSLRELAAK